MYNQNRGTDNAVLTMMNCVIHHLQNPNAYVRGVNGHLYSGLKILKFYFKGYNCQLSDECVGNKGKCPMTYIILSVY